MDSREGAKDAYFKPQAAGLRLSIGKSFRLMRLRVFVRVRPPGEGSLHSNNI